VRKSRFLAAAGITAALVTGSAVAAPMAMAASPEAGGSGAGKFVQERNGLQCVSAWKDSIGGSLCYGNKNVKWRGHVVCFWIGGEKIGSWNKGHGINASSCPLGVERAFVEWD
jgi:predicted lipoprotein with Yx(FWY)xxD motif